ncbi:MAG: thiol-disulfide isomerase [Candidatus Acidiferrum sp.]|jgi:mono/diheme cytochrome c family protein
MVLRRLIFVLMLLVFCDLSLGAGQDSPSATKEVTFNRDVAPIFYNNCVKCHRPNDIAPMSLLTYKDARPWARAIREAVVTRKMPPWHADPNVGEFLNDPRLTDEQIATIDAWVRGGTTEGDPKDLPAAPVFVGGWHIKPDVVFTIPETLVSGGSQDDYEYIYVPTNFTEDRWIQAAEVLPGDRRVVHHATVSVIAANLVAKKEEENTKADAGVDPYHYRTGKVLHLRKDAPVVDDGCADPNGGGVPGMGAGYLNIVPGIYLPGHLAETRPPGYALRIPAGSYLQFQVHYSNRTGDDVKDNTSIGLVFAKEPVKHEIAQYEIWNDLFLIPANDANHRVTSCYTLPRDVTVLAYTGHMHFRGKSMTTEAVYPDGRHEVILNIPHYDFRWQETYFLKKQFDLPKGTKLVTTAYFDNSFDNPQNPDPGKAIRWGEPSDEEMMGFWLQFADPAPVNLKASLLPPSAGMPH